MNKLVYSALAITLCSVPGLASDNWSALDQELNSLSASLTAQNQSGPKIGGWVISSFRASSDDALQVGGNDLQGFQLDSARIEITGDAGSDYSYKVSFDLESGTASIKDAYAKWKIAEGVNGKMGRYKTAFFQSSLISENRLLFLERSALGEVFSSRDLGFEISGEFDTIQYWAGVQNGTDNNGDEHLFSARVRASLMGNGTGKVEGAYGSGDESNLSAGLSWQDDGNVDKGTVIGLEVQMTTGPFSIAGEIADFDEGTAGAFGITNATLDQFGIVGNDVAETTPWGLTGSYMFTDMYEAAVRYEDADDDEDTSSIKVGVNRYVQNHDIKWQLEWQHVKTENASGDFDILGVGLAVSI
ncbi:MAG: hypothetical protein IPJ77_04670 [Planctomycetes bacterium]|nr:hypothetical protein [Planctomycetota bacterium]